MSAEGILPFEQTDYPQNIGWIKVKLGEVCKLKNGFAFKSSEYKPEGVPIIRISDIKEGIVTCENSIKIEPKAEYEDYLIEKNDILIAMSGATTGKFGIFKDKLKAYQNQRVGNFKFLDNDGLNKSFLFYQLYSLKQSIEKDAYGGAQPNISSKKIEEMEIIIAPLPEQRAIVSKIEQLFSELDNGISNLKLAQEQLKVYRQAVLKKAFEGELTKKWREQQTDLPDVGELLEQIRKEREEDSKVFGKKPNKVKSLTDTGSAELPKLPVGWIWSELGEVIDNIQAGKSIKCDERIPKSNELGIVKVSAVSWGEFNENESKTCFSEEAFNADYIIHKNDFLFSRANTIELVGACVIVKSINKHLMLSDKILKIDFSQNHNIFYSLYYLRSVFGRKEIESLATGNQESMRNIGQDRIKRIKIPICSPPEQQAIVQEIETRLSVCDKIEQDIETNLEKAEALRQSILKKAFEGKLLNERELAEVRGAEDWESAEVLLERIRKESAGNGKKEKQTSEKLKKVVLDDRELTPQYTLEDFDQIDK